MIYLAQALLAVTKRRYYTRLFRIFSGMLMLYSRCPSKDLIFRLSRSGNIWYSVVDSLAVGFSVNISSNLVFSRFLTSRAATRGAATRVRLSPLHCQVSRPFVTLQTSGGCHGGVSSIAPSSCSTRPPLFQGMIF